MSKIEDRIQEIEELIEEKEIEIMNLREELDELYVHLKSIHQEEIEEQNREFESMRL